MVKKHPQISFFILHWLNFLPDGCQEIIYKLWFGGFVFDFTRFFTIRIFTFCVFITLFLIWINNLGFLKSNYLILKILNEICF